MGKRLDKIISGFSKTITALEMLVEDNMKEASQNTVEIVRLQDVNKQLNDEMLQANKIKANLTNLFN